MMRSPILFLTLLAAACNPKTPPELPSNNGDETPERECRVNADCEAGYVCAGRECEPGPCLDGMRSLGETDVDCGGRQCAPCANGSTCQFGTDCESGSCDGLCGEATANNGVAPECEDPGTPERFVLWEDTGIAVDVTYEANTRGAAPFTVGGVAIFDYDGDGDVDVMVTNQGAELALFANDGSGAFTDVTESAGVSGLTRTTSLSVADFDGDADRDVIVGRTLGGVYVLVNQGNGTFADETAAWGIDGSIEAVSGGAFGDFDGDGDLDFYVGAYTPPVEIGLTFEFPPPIPNRLYRNDGTTVNEITTSPGRDGEAGATLAGAFWDFDADGRPDIWSSNDFGMIIRPSQLWRNVGPDPNDPDNWLFEDISAASGVGVSIFAMSATLADFDNDGDQDGYASNMAQNVLHVVDGTTTTDEAVARGVDCSVVPDPRPAPQGEPDYTPKWEGMEEFLAEYADADSGMFTLTSWASIFFDADHDGWQDLYVVNGTTLTDLTPEAVRMPNYLYESQGGGQFEKAPCWRLPDIRGTSRGAAAGDLDGDGDLDLVWVDQGDYGEPGVYVLRNEMAQGNWLTVELRGSAPNTDAIGAKLTLRAGGQTQTRWIDGGQGYLSVSERVAHFGLADAEIVDSVDVTWPDGTTTGAVGAGVNQRLVFSLP